MNRYNIKATLGGFLAVIILMLPLSSIAATSASSNNDPVQMLSTVAHDMMAELRKNKATLKTDPNYVYSLTNNILIPHVDVDVMSRAVLTRSVWKNATKAQQNQFKQQFKTLVVHTYASALAGYTDQKIRFFPLRGGVAGRKRLTVHSQIIQSGGPAISVNYRLFNRGNRWRVYDLSVDGISLLQSFRSQFADEIAQGKNLADLVKLLKSHNAQNPNSK